MRRVLNQLRALAVPRALRSGGVLRNVWELNVHILRDYGWLRSLREQQSVDASGDPIPWMTYPAIDFLAQLDFSEKSVFEYGSGASTVFWAQRARRVVSIESDRRWFVDVSARVAAHCEVVLSASDSDTYARQIRPHGTFDVIVIDGPGETRSPCCREALRHLAPGGFVVLDNSDLWPAAAAILRESGLIQVDFTGFAPLGPHAHTTSVFFERGYRFSPCGARQPVKSVAQPVEPWP